MANKLGFYLHNFEIGEHKPALFAAIREVQPPTILVHAWDQVDQLRQMAPQSFIIGRMTYFGQDKTPLEHLVNNWLSDPHPEDRGRDFADHILRDNFEAALKREGDRLQIDAWMSLNEVVPGPASEQFAENPGETGRRLRAFDAFQVGFRDKLIEQGIEAVAFNFGAGNFATAKHYLDFFPNTLKSYTYLGFHEYGWPALSTSVNPGAVSSAGSYRGIVVGLRQALGRDFQAILTEAGLTFTHKFSESGFDEGWLFKPPPEFETPPIAQDEYWASLEWLNKMLEQDGFARGACLFEVAHEGKRINFRHFGADNSGQPIRIMERIKALNQAALTDLGLEPAVPAPLQDFTGRVVDQEGSPIPGAMLRIIAGLETLGGDPRAVSNARGTVTWTQVVTGFSGSLWNGWQKYVANDAAAITWEEFRREAVQYNPSLRDSDEVMLADRRYFLPENRVGSGEAESATDVVWDRVVPDFDGDLWACWRKYLRGKVVGMTWKMFRRRVRDYNPGLTPAEKANGRTQTIVLPRNSSHDEYTRVTFSDAEGRFRFESLPGGSYRLEGVAEGFLPDTRNIIVPAEGKIVIGLKAPLAAQLSGDELGLAVGAGDFVQRAGRDFVLHGRRFRFIGVNLRGLVHYGDKPVESANMHQQLQSARDIGVRVVRVFAPHKNVSPADTVSRLQNLVSLMDSQFPEMYLIVCLSNLYGDVDFRVPGDPESVYSRQPGGSGPHILGADWFREGYKGAYTTFAKTIVTAFRDSPRIMAYNVGNELKLEIDQELFVKFMLTMASQIKTWDARRHLLTTGMISTRHSALEHIPGLRERLYGSNDIDFITNHAYHDRNFPDKPSIEDDSDLSFRLSKPLLIEEAGIEGSDDRSRFYEMDLQLLMDEKRASGFMPWGFMAGHNNGDGDKALGFDQEFHGADWNRLRGIFSERSRRLAEDNVVIDAPKPAAKFTVGQRVFTQAAVKLRPAPGLSSEPAVLLPARTQVEITGNDESANNLPWWPVRVGTKTGFIAQRDPLNRTLLAAA